MLRNTWSREELCPMCGSSVVWTMDDSEYSEVRRLLELAGRGAHWTAEVVCGSCDGRLMVGLTLADGGLSLELLHAVDAPPTANRRPG